MLTYGQVEAVLAKMHHINADAMGAFRGRIRHFQRVGIVPASPGRGKKISYEMRDLLMWGYCLEFAQLGMDPTVIKSIVDRSFDTFLNAYNALGNEDEEWRFGLRLNLMTHYIYNNINDNRIDIDVLKSEYQMMMTESLLSEKYSDEYASHAEFARRYIVIDVRRFRNDLRVALRQTEGIPKEFLGA
jgi:hypothetical protein